MKQTQTQAKAGAEPSWAKSGQSTPSQTTDTGSRSKCLLLDVTKILPSIIQQ